MGLSSSTSSSVPAPIKILPVIKAKDDLDEFLGLGTLPEQKRRKKTKARNNDTQPEVIDDTLVCPKAKLIATLITPDHVTSPNDPYYLIQDYVNFSQSPNFGVKILKICKLTRCSETQDWSYDNVTTNSNRMMLWHGTKYDRVRGILENGFLKPSSAAYLNFGPGIYFADRIAKCSTYCGSSGKGHEPMEGEIGFMFLCEVQMGRIFETTTTGQHFQRPPKQCRKLAVFDADDKSKRLTTKGVVLDCDSVKYVGSIEPDVKGNREVNGIVWPLGSTISGGSEGIDNGGVVVGVAKGKNFKRESYNEYIVYEPSKIRINYLVKVEFTKEPVFNICAKET